MFKWIKALAIIKIIYDWYERAADDGQITVEEGEELVREVAKELGFEGKLKILL